MEGIDEPIEEKEMSPDNVFLQRYIERYRGKYPNLKMVVNGTKIKDIEAFLEVDLSRNKHYSITFEI